jgi:hypothetical protein
MLARQQKLSQLAQQLADRVRQPETLALVMLATGTAWFFQGRWRTAHEFLERAEPMLRDCSTGIAWELDTTCLYHLLALFYLGEVKELSARLPTFLKEARERDDLTAPPTCARGPLISCTGGRQRGTGARGRPAGWHASRRMCSTPSTRGALRARRNRLATVAAGRGNGSARAGGLSSVPC